MDIQFTAVYRKVPEGYVASVEELPGANTQGATLEEARTSTRPWRSFSRSIESWRERNWMEPRSFARR